MTDMSHLTNAASLLQRRSLLTATVTALAVPGLVRKTRAAPALKTVRVMDMPKRWSGYEILFLAQDKGFFEAHGLKLDLVPLPNEQYNQVVGSGVVDFALSADYIWLINVRNRGLKVKDVVGSSPIINPAGAGDGVFVRADSPIQRAEDLRGKTIGMRSVAFSSAWFTLDYLHAKGVEPKDVKLVNIPDLQLEQVLSSGAVDAAFAYSPIDAQLRRHGGYRQLFQISDLSGRAIQRGGSVTTEDFIARNPEAVAGYARAIGEAADYANAHPQELIDLGVKLGRVNPEYAKYLYTMAPQDSLDVLKWPSHGNQNRDDIKFWLGVAVRQGLVADGHLTVDELYINPDA